MGGYSSDQEIDADRSDCSLHLGWICDELQKLFVPTGRNGLAVIPALEAMLHRGSRTPPALEEVDVDVNEEIKRFGALMGMLEEHSMPIETCEEGVRDVKNGTDHCLDHWFS